MALFSQRGGIDPSTRWFSASPLTTDWETHSGWINWIVQNPV